MKSVIFAALCVIVLSVAQEFQDFKCNSASPNYVSYFDNELKCPNGTICNVKGQGSAKAKPCVFPREICDYSCNKEDVVINSVVFSCGPDKECNAAKTTCNVCLDKPCNKNAWTCKDSDIGKFYIGSAAYDCTVGTKCNKDYKPPCNPCIESESGTPGISAPVNQNFYFSFNNSEIAD